MRAAILTAVMLLGACTAARAQTPPEGIVWVALRDINEAYADAEDPTNRPPLAHTPPEGMIRPVDVSRDGKPDWLIDYQASGLNGYCGTGGCLQRLYVSDGDAYVRAVENQALELEFEDGRVTAWVHHVYCAGDNRDCRYVFAWDPAAGKLTRTGAIGDATTGDEAWTPIRPAGE